MERVDGKLSAFTAQVLSRTAGNDHATADIPRSLAEVTLRLTKLASDISGKVVKD